MPKQMTQAGFNRVVWKMLTLLGGKFTISEREVERINKDAIRIQHDPATHTFVFTLCKTEENKSNLILPNMN